jgi:hypothetical protein
LEETNLAPAHAPKKKSNTAKQKERGNQASGPKISVATVRTEMAKLNMFVFARESAKLEGVRNTLAEVKQQDAVLAKQIQAEEKRLGVDRELHDEYLIHHSEWHPFL